MEVTNEMAEIPVQNDKKNTRNKVLMNESTEKRKR